MKTTVKAAISAALCSTLLCGCIGDPGSNESTRGTAVRFSTTIPKTRAYDNKWEYGDHIGVYMLPAGSTDWHDPETAPLASNRKYGHDMERGDAATGDVIFSGVDEANTLVWPGGDKKVDFTAYYPWREAADPDDFTYRIDISDQDPQKDIDLMWSNNIRGQSSGSPELRFTHRLTKLVFNVTDLDGTSLEDMVATFEGLPTLAGFDLATGDMIDSYDPGADDPLSFRGWRSSAGNEEEAGGEAIVEAIVLPGSELDYKVTFSIGSSGEKAVFSPSKNGKIDYGPGKRYIYNIRLQPRRGEDASFGADGELESINDWETPEEDGGDHDVDKTGDVGKKWESSPLSSAQNGYTLAVNPNDSGSDNGQDGYMVQSVSTLTIAKDDYEGGISSIGVSLKSGGGFSSGGKSVSVKVGGTDLVTGDGGAAGASSVEFGVVAQAATYTFRPANGKPLTGGIEIVVKASDGWVSVVGFAVNADK